MAPVTRGIPNGISADSDNDSDASYNMAKYAMSPTSTSSSKSKGKEMAEPKKIDNLSFEDAVTDPGEEEPNYHGEQTSILTSWISKISGMQNNRPADAAQSCDSIEKIWLQSAEQMTGDSDVESVISNDSGLGNPETQLNEDFTDLQLDADLQSVRNDIQTEAESIIRTLDDIHLGDETAVPRDISVQLRKHARAIVYIFGDDVVLLKRKIKGQNEETQKLIHKYEVERARTNTVTAETIYKLEKEEDGEIKCIKLCHRSEIQELRKQYEESEQRHQKQTALFEEKIALLKIDYLAYRALKGEHKKLKDQLEAFEAQTSLLVESMVQQSRDSQECVDVQLAQASNQISELRYEKAANDEKMVGCVREAQGYEEERNAALFEVSELRNVVEDLKARVKGSKKRDAELTQALEREEKKENSAPKQQIQAFQPATINKQPNIKLYLTLWQVDETGSLSGKYEIVTSKSTADTLGPFKAFAEVAANNLPTTGQKDPLEVRHRKDMHQTPAAQRVAAEEHAKLFVQKGVFEIASTIKAHQDRNQALELENATLKDKVAEVKAQLEHARTGNKCTRDALAQLNEELKALNKDKEEANWTLREALVTSWTQVETLGQKLKQEQEKTLLKAHPERPGSHNYLKSAEEAIRPCGECLTSKLELSNYRNHMVRHHKEKENLRKALSKSHGENANLQQRLNQANVNITRLQTDANTAQHYHQKLLKRANKINDERKDLEEQLHRAQIELSGTKSRLSISETEVKSLSAEVVACKNELEVAKEKLEEDDMDDKVTQRHCLVLAQHQAVLKARAAVAERTLREEKTSCKSFREKLQRDVEELVKRTGGVGSSNHEVLGQWAIDEPGGSRS